MSRALTLTLALAACGPKAASTETTTPDPTTDPGDGDGGGGVDVPASDAAMSCAAMGDALEAEATADATYSGSQIRQMRAMIVDECDGKAWSQDALACFASVTGAAAWASCASALPADQQASLQQLSVDVIVGE